MTTVVVALGGNALTKPGEAGTAAEQASNAAGMAVSVGELVTAGHRIVVTHGNGPQVGNLAIQQFAARDLVPALPLHLMGAMTQGYMGSIIIRALWDQLPGHRGRLAAIVTHAIVRKDDAAFSKPTKPIGPFLEDDEVTDARARGWTVAEDSGRGHRRMVPSPRPREVLEAAAIESLLDNDFLVVAGGGGGIPTTRNPDGLQGVEAVIDKDRLAVQIALAVKAEVLALVTGVDHVLLGFGTPHERSIGRMTTSEAAHFMAAGEFPAGSMGPKIESAIEFVDGGGEYAVITSTDQLAAALRGEAGSRVVRNSAA
jgi:carbamate kinase